MSEVFRRIAREVSNRAGSVTAFLIAFGIVLVWAVTGPVFRFSDTWQLVINTGTTIVTFLMVFLIQNTQNRDSQAIHTKLDELLVATQGARNSLAIAEELSDRELSEEKAHFEQVAQATMEVRGQTGNGRERGPARTTSFKKPGKSTRAGKGPT
jgi:low affinity Fe/Cu permease